MPRPQKNRSGDAVSVGQLIDQKRQSKTWMFDVVDNIRKRTILRAIAEANGNRSQAARLLGIHRAVLYEYIDQYGLR